LVKQDHAYNTSSPPSRAVLRYFGAVQEGVVLS